MKIDADEVRHVAALARLELSPDEIEVFRGQLDSILTYMDKLRELETTDVPPTSHVISMATPFREDRVRPSIPREEALGNAPDSEGGCFKVPRMISP